MVCCVSLSAPRRPHPPLPPTAALGPRRQTRGAEPRRLRHLRAGQHAGDAALRRGVPRRRASAGAAGGGAGPEARSAEPGRVAAGRRPEMRAGAPDAGLPAGERWRARQQGGRGAACGGRPVLRGVHRCHGGGSQSGGGCEDELRCDAPALGAAAHLRVHGPVRAPRQWGPLREAAAASAALARLHGCFATRAPPRGAQGGAPAWGQWSRCAAVGRGVMPRPPLLASSSAALAVHSRFIGSNQHRRPCLSWTTLLVALAAEGSTSRRHPPRARERLLLRTLFFTLSPSRLHPLTMLSGKCRA